MMLRILISIIALSCCLFIITSCTSNDIEPVIDLDHEQYKNWHSYLGDKEVSQYSSLTQITKENIDRLDVAWTFSTGDLIEGERTEIQANPLIIDGILYGTTPLKKAFALKADTGEMLWMFDPFEGEEPRSRGVNRGFATWSDDSGNRRLFYVAGPRLWAIDASTGNPVSEFGENGSLDFSIGLDRDAVDIRVTATSPGVVYKELLIHGSRVYNLAPGHIRAFNVRTGEIEWVFRTIPYPGDYGYDTWPADAWTRIGNTNSWAGMSLDVERGIVYAPVASPGHDFYGGDRIGENLFGSSLVALDAATGERKWHYQFVRHDIWDYDPPSTPNLVTIKRDGQLVDAVAQITKTGHVYVLDRDSGEPLFPMTEVEVPPSDLKGEEVWPTQPVPVLPKPFARQQFTEDDITDITPESRQTVLDRYREIRTGSRWDPPSMQGTLIFPGFDGGGEWGGAAFDPETGILYVNANEMPWILQMVETDQVDDGYTQAESIYALNCAICHGSNRTGVQHGANPSLVDVDERLNDDELYDVLGNGRGVMPSFSFLSDEEIDAIIEFLKDPDAPDVNPVEITMSRAPQVPYTHTGYNRFFDPEGYPAIKPPWGTLNAIDLNTGEHLWNIPLGEFEELTARGIPQTGTENYGGPVVTAGGVLFIGATQDEKFRAFDKSTGDLLWETDLPAGGYATPAVYEVNGQQYVVIAAGGGKMGTKSGDTYVAFSLNGKD